MKQAVLTPDCPRCHGPLWFVPCPYAAGCCHEHYECQICGVEWVYRQEVYQWIRFAPDGSVIEILPPPVPRFRRQK